MLVDKPTAAPPKRDAGAPAQIPKGGEERFPSFNKLPSNIGMAGVHWRSDYSEGLKLGEAVAISILREQKLLYRRENFSGFTFTNFDGQTIAL